VTRWPNLFIVGTPRAGTTSLWHYLGGHPEIYMSPMKEPQYFNDRPPVYVPAVSTESDYLALFAGARGERYLGDATPAYLHAPGAAVAIAAASPDARAVAVLREPVSRLYSSYWLSVRYGRETRSVEEALIEPVARPSELPSAQYFDRSFYATPVRTFKDVFGERLHVLWFDDLVRDVRGAVRGILDFLALDPAYAASFDTTRRNETGLPRNRTVARLYAAPRMLEASRNMVPNRLRGRVESLLLTTRSIPELDPAYRDVLEPVFDADRDRLERVLGRSVPWGR
jgi:hypothetical protein